MSATMVERQRKNEKKLWEKGTRAVPQNMRLGARYNDSKPRIWNSFFGNIISGKNIFYICPHVPVDVIIDFFLMKIF